MEIMGRNRFLIAYFASYRIQRDVYEAGIVRITETNDRQITTLVNRVSWNMALQTYPSSGLLKMPLS